MKEEAKSQIGAYPCERINSRKAHRNGYRQRALKTRYGTVELSKPQIREFPFETQVFDKYSRVEKATRNAIVESYIQGVSTRRILGVKVAMNESEGFWMDFFEEMKTRGLRGVKLIISDGHMGIKKAVEKSFLGASWQMCHVHFMRIITSKVPKKKWKWAMEKVKEALSSSDETKLEELIEEFEKAGLEKAARSVEKYRYDLFNYKAFPKSHWRRIRTTNVLERLNKELKRMGRVVGAFPTVGSLMRLIGSILIDQEEEYKEMSA